MQQVFWRNMDSGGTERDGVLKDSSVVIRTTSEEG